MSGSFPDQRTCSIRTTRPLIWALCCLVFALNGCNQGTPATSPWANPFAPPASPAAANSQALANQQYQLALAQQQKLAELEATQRQSEQQLALMREQERQAKLRAFEQEEKQEALVAQRAREVLGRYDDLGLRARSLDQNNQDLFARVAKVQQRAQLVEDQNHLLRKRLEDTSRQLATALDANKATQERLQTMTASVQRRSVATITANNSYRRNLTAVTVTGLAIRQDGELVRIELPADRLFQPGTANLRSEAAAQIDQVANVFLDHYPRQVIGVESHTDSTSVGGNWRNAHQLTVSQAMAVFEQLSSRHQLLPQQMFVLGHGANSSLASNATEAGRARNRRIEIVVYPDTVGQR